MFVIAERKFNRLRVYLSNKFVLKNTEPYLDVSFMCIAHNMLS